MYKAIACKIETAVKHPNADRLQLCTVAGGYQIITDLKAKVGDLGVYFPVDGQVSEEFAKANNLLEIKDPKTGKKIGGGFMDYKRRVRAMSLRGIKSMGLWLDISCLDYLDIVPSLDKPSLLEGTQFSEIDGHPICNKYYTAATLSAREKSSKVGNKGHYKSYTCFKQHIDTEQFMRFFKEIPVNSYMVATLKLHGTSAVTGRVLVDNYLPWWKKVINFIRPGYYKEKEYKCLIGTRNVVLADGKQDGYYKGDQFRFNIADSFKDKLNKGETVYYEIVGYDSNGKPLMSTHSTKTLKKEYPGITKFGEEFAYSYGCQPGTQKIYVYRITMCNEDGVAYDLSWEQVKGRCRELGLEHVPELCKFIYRGNVEETLAIVAGWLSDNDLKPSLLDHTHIDEGVCFRVDTDKPHAVNYKHKAFIFQILEGIKKESDDYVDLEEVS